MKKNQYLFSYGTIASHLLTMSTTASSVLASTVSGATRTNHYIWADGPMDTLFIGPKILPTRSSSDLIMQEYLHFLRKKFVRFRKNTYLCNRKPQKTARQALCLMPRWRNW